MNHPEPTRSVGDYVGLFRRRGHILALGVPAALLLGVLAAYLLPATYRATGVLMAEGAAISSDLVRSTTAADDKDVTLDSLQRIELLRRKVMKVPALADLVRKADPQPDRPELSAEDKANAIIGATSLEPVNPVTFERARGSTAFAVHYENEDPKVAAAVGTALLNLFVEYNSRVRTEQAAEATQFLRSQAQALEKDLNQAERKLAEFKSRFGDALPNSEGRNMMGADRARRDLDDVQRRIVAAEERESLLRVQLAEISPTLSSAVGNWRTEIAKLKGELAIAQQKYTPDHPDVKRAYDRLEQPGFKPPRKVFSLVWPPLFLALTVSGLRIWNAPPSQARTASSFSSRFLRSSA